MTLTSLQTLAILTVVVIGTQITRFLPFLLFRTRGAQHPYVTYLGQVLPYAAIGLLVVYCLKNVSFQGPGHGIPESVAIAVIVLLHYWKENTLVSIGAGTAIYMILMQTLF